MLKNFQRSELFIEIKVNRTERLQNKTAHLRVGHGSLELRVLHLRHDGGELTADLVSKVGIVSQERVAGHQQVHQLRVAGELVHHLLHLGHLHCVLKQLGVLLHLPHEVLETWTLEQSLQRGPWR